MPNQEFSMESRDASPANLLMKIESFSLLSTYRISEYESREFEAGGHKWKIIIYLQGEYISVCLSAETKSLPMNWEINVIFTFFVFNHFSNDYLCFRGKLRRFNTVTTRLWFSKLISKKKLRDPSNGYLVDDNCVFGAEVFVIKGDQRVNACLCLPKETTNMEVTDLVVGDYKCEPRNVDLYQKGNEIKLDDANHHKKVQILSEYSAESRITSPANLLMKIESFSLLSMNGISEFESREFESGGHKWKIIIYLEGEDVSVCLSACGTESLPMDGEINVIFTFFIFNHFSNNYLCFRGKSRRFNTVNPRCWFSKLIPKKELTDPSNGCLVDDNFVFGAEVYVIKADHRLNQCLCLFKETALVKHQWKLSNFSKMENVWYSEVFVTGGYNWKVALHPKGNGSGEGRCVSVFLHCVDASNFAPHQRVKARFMFRVKKINGVNLSEMSSCDWFRSTKDDWGYPEFIARSKGFLADDCCFLQLGISLQAAVLDAPN